MNTLNRLSVGRRIGNMKNAKCNLLTGQTVITGISSDRPPAQLNTCRAHTAQTDHEEHVKDGGTDDRTRTDVGFRNKDTENGGEQFGWRWAGRHKRCAGHVVAQAQLAGAQFERRQKVVITNDGQTEEHVDGDQNVDEDETSGSQLVAE